MTATLVGVAVQVVRDNSGSWYVGGGLSLGRSATLVSGSVTGGWIVQPGPPPPEQFAGFISGWSVSGGGGALLGGNVNWGGVPSLTPHDVALESGLFSPQIGVNVTYSWRVG